MSTEFKRFNRRFHFWSALVIFLPVAIVIGSGLLLQVKKQVSWVQPATIKGTQTIPTLSFEQILSSVSVISQTTVNSWSDIDRIDVRPGKGMMKVVTKDNWEIQLDSGTAEVLQVEYRRSDLIESIHDGSFFHKHAKLWFFLPVAIVLTLIWVSGGVMLYLQLANKSKRKRRTKK